MDGERVVRKIALGQELKNTNIYTHVYEENSGKKKKERERDWEEVARMVRKKVGRDTTI